MRPARIIFLYAVAVVVLGALLAPGFYWLVHPDKPQWLFRRVFDRSLLIVAVVGLWPMLRKLEIRSWRELGYGFRPAWWREALSGFVLGVGSFAVGGALLLALGVRSITGWDGSVFKFLLTGIVVGILEETLFRGGIFGALRRGFPLWPAILLAGAIYSAVHFLKPKGTQIDIVTWLSGFDQLGQVFRNSFQADGVAISFVTLLLAGVILAVAFVRTRTLYLSVGLHAGWVFALKSFAAMTDATGPRQWWGGGTLVDNLLVWPVLLVVWWVISKWPTQSSNG